jgi:membrane protein YqaA with SNARE-associated domain
MITNLAVVLVLGVLGIWKSIPVGFILDINPILVCVMTILGASLGSIVVYLVGTKVRKYFGWMSKSKGVSKKHKRISGIFMRYGVPGLGLIAPLLIGPGVTMAVGMTIVKNGKQLLLWTNIGIVAWSILLTCIGQVGVSLF